MRFGTAHRAMTSALAVLGVLALITSGRLGVVTSALICLGLALALALPERLRQSSGIKFLGVVLPIAFLVLQLGRLVIGQEPIPIIVEFTAGLQVVRLATRRGAQHDHQVILLALLQLIVGTVLGSGLAYAFSLLGFLVFTPGALVLSHLRREVEGNYQQGAKDRSGSPVDVPRILRSRRVISRNFLFLTCFLALPVFLVTSVIFVVFPRVGFAWFKVEPIEASRVVGFSDHVDLGGVGKIRSNPRLVMRVQPLQLEGEAPPRLNFYFRGASFDRYENGAWQKTIRERVSFRSIAGYGVLKKLPAQSVPADYLISLEPIQPKVIFLPERTSAIKFIFPKGLTNTKRPEGYLGTNGEIIYVNESRHSLNYKVFLTPEGERVPDALNPEERKAYLDLPDSFSPRMKSLAREWTSEESSLVRAREVELRLRSDYTYDLASTSGEADDPLADFLFRTKRGHCEFYSTAMVLFLRSLGIPARNVTGFVGGTYNRFGDFYGVRQGDAHSWVEAYLDGQGWTRFDPTPPGNAQALISRFGIVSSLRELMEAAGKSWEQNVVGFDLNQQLKLAQTVGHAAKSARKKTGDLLSSAVSRWPYLLIVLLGFAGAFGAFLLKKRQKANVGLIHESLSLERSRALYSEIEKAMVRLDCRRPSSCPPLKHARTLLDESAPCARELFELTEVYLAVRFGEESLSERELDRSKEKLKLSLKAQLS